MADAPAAEVRIDTDLIERLVAAQHPDLVAPVRIVSNGWDNIVARLGEHHAVRLPRRAAAAPLIEHEARWLPGLAECLTVAVPAAIRVGQPTDDYPWTWLIVPWIAGTPVTEVPISRRLALASDLGAAHAALHRPAPPDAPRNPVRGVPLAIRDAVARERIAQLPQAARLLESWENALAAPPWSGPPLWLHGDPHAGNLLATTDSAADSTTPRLAALIDFGDLTSGDPATDLAAAWMLFDPAGRAAYRAALERADALDDATWRRAHGWALLMGAALALSSDDNPAMAAIGVHTMEQVLADPPA